MTRLITRPVCPGALPISHCQRRGCSPALGTAFKNSDQRMCYRV